MRIPFKKYPRPKGGFAYAAVLDVSLAHPKTPSLRSKRFEAWVDSGAARTTIHAEIGRMMGFEIEKGEVEEHIGITGKPSRTYLHDVILYVPGGPVQIRAAFNDELPLAALLGMEGFFDHFRVTLDSAAKETILERFASPVLL